VLGADGTAGCPGLMAMGTCLRATLTAVVRVACQQALGHQEVTHQNQRKGSGDSADGHQGILVDRWRTLTTHFTRR
jgi:hypothetical protein